MNRLLEFDSVVVSFDRRPILANIAVRVKTGEVVALLGRNGSGKSTLLKVVFGSMKAEFKSVRVDGQVVWTGFPVISYLPQHGMIPSHVQVRTAIRLFGVNEEEMILEYPETAHHLRHTPSQLSGGTRRILETILLLKSRAPFCLLDEPFQGVSPVHVEMLQGIIRRHQPQKGIVVTDHRYRSVLDIAQRIYTLVNGQTYLVEGEDDLIRRGYLSGS